MKILASIALAIAAFAPSKASANELFGGVYVHDVDTFLSISGVEDGADLQIGWRGNRLGRTRIQPYAFLSAHTAGQTHFAAVGLSAKFGDRFFIRPGLGVAVHTGSAANFQIEDNDEIEFGSRVLFEPELGVGARVNDRISIEASWVHLSQGQIFGRQNPGIDSLGVRLTVQLP